MTSRYGWSFILLLVGCNYVVANDQKESLVYAVVVHRHGERTPLEIYPNDPHQADTWPIGLSQLTNAGKQRLYMLGLFLRERYRALIGNNYNVSTITAISSDKDRTIMSVQSLLAALYPPGSWQVWNQNINWQPIPVHTISNDDDNVLGWTKFCPKYDQDVDNLKNIPEVHKILDSYHDLMTYVSKHSGVNVTNYGAKDLKNITTIYDTLSIELNNNLSIPNWAKPVLGELGQALPISFGIYYYTEEMQRLTSGVILKEILHQLRMKVNQNDDFAKNMTIYSAHDSTIVAILCAVKSYNFVHPSYGSALLFELHKHNQTDEYIVKIFYRNDTKEEPHYLNLPNCPAPCTIDAFAESIHSILPVDWDEECRVTITFNNVSYAVAIFIIAALVLIVVFVRCCLLRNKKMQKTGSLKCNLQL